jgi:hypothetical protein
MITKLCHAAFGVTIALSSPIATANDTDADIVSMKLGEVRLVLEERGSVCFMKRVDAGGGARFYSLEIPYPCTFHKSTSGDVRTIRRGKYQYALIESSKYAGVSTSECETHLRAIRAAGTHFQISRHKDKVASCPPFQWDRLMFTELFD